MVDKDGVTASVAMLRTNFPNLDCFQRSEIMTTVVDGFEGAGQAGNVPAGAGEDWSTRRSPRRDQDRVLQSQTHIWLRKIPSAIHPKQLCRHYPRIANGLALVWGDKSRVEQMFEDLLHDRRGQRKGFSERVRVEIERLERFHARKLHVNYPPVMVVRHRRLPAAG